MAVVGDNRGGQDRPVAQRPDGSWSFEDARRRRDQRQAGRAAPAPPAARDPDEDLSALALSLADNAMTTDGTPLSQLEMGEFEGSDAFGLPSGRVPTAEEIMRALEDEQHAAFNRNGAEDAQPVRSPRQPSARQGRNRRRLRARRWVMAGALGAVVATLLVIEVSFGGDTTSRQQSGHSATSRTAAPTARLIAAVTDKFLAIEHAPDRNLSTARTRKAPAPRPARHRQTPVRTASRAASGSISSPTTSSTSGATEAVHTTQQTSSPTYSPSSSSRSSGSSPPPPATQSHTSPSSNSGSPSTTPSKAALKSLVTGAGTCSCQ